MFPLHPGTILLCLCTFGTIFAVTVNIGVLLQGGERYIFTTSRVKPGVDIALETITKRIQDGEYVNFTLKSYYQNTGPVCPSYMNAAGIASMMYFRNDVVAFIGPPCSFETISVSDLSAFWNIPVVSGVSTSSTLDNKARFKTLTRTAYKLGTLGAFIAQVFDKYNWRRCSIVWDNWATFRIASSAIRATLLAREFHIHDVPIQEFGNEEDAFDEAAINSRSKYNVSCCQFCHEIYYCVYCSTYNSI